MSESDKPAAPAASASANRAKRRKRSEPVPFGPYRLLNLLGQGGMGRVYRAVRYGPQGGEEELALKILDRRATSTSSQVRALVDEVRLGQLLRHPNIVRTDELRKVGDSYCIAMEYVEGWPLDRMIELHQKQSQPIPLVTALSLMLSIAEGLTYAHDLRDEKGKDLGLVHRDLKPGNVMVSRSGSVKLMDFGTAKSAANLYQTEDGETRGTPLYMSPEQVMGHDLDQRSDIFSMGSILYELIMLEPCFKGTNLVMVMRNVADADLDEQREDISNAAAALEPIFSRCMQLEPENRYQSITELAQELHDLRDSRPPGPSIQEWLDSLSGRTPDIATGDFGSVAVPGTTGDLPSGNIQSLDTNELRVAREMAGDSSESDPSLQRTLNPEYARTQLLGEATAIGSKSGVSPVAPETADVLKTDEIEPLEDHDEIEPLDDHDKAAPAIEHEPPRFSPPTEPEAAPAPPVAAPAPTQAQESRRTPLLKTRQRGTGRFWLRQLFRLVVVLAVGLAFVPMLPKDLQERLKASASAIFEPLSQVGDSRSKGPQDGTDGWEHSRFLDEVVHLDAGELLLGAAGNAAAAPSPGPIAIPPFDIMAYEVSVGDFQSWCRGKASGEACQDWAGPEKWQESGHPVVGVTWNEARTFCESWGGRLPTESEWEMAARGSEGRNYPWGADWSKGRANYCDLGCQSTYLPSTYEDDGVAKTGALGSFPNGATKSGIYNLAGNVSEWTLDCWSEGHGDRSNWHSSSEKCHLRVKRGGSWKGPFAMLTGWYRSSGRLDSRSAQVGFRCVRGRTPFAEPG